MKKSFTLIELLVVIAIIGILAAILLPALNRASNRASLVTCQNNEAQLVKGAVIHATDHKYDLPHSPSRANVADWTNETVDSWAGNLYDYIKDRRVFRCDSAKEASGATGDLLSYSSPWPIQSTKYNVFDSPAKKVLYFCYQADSQCVSVPREIGTSTWNALKAEDAVVAHGDNMTSVAFVDGHTEFVQVDSLTDDDNFLP